MSQAIDTPFGPYTPQVPSQREMDRAQALMADALEAIAELNHDVWAQARIADGWRNGPKRDDARKLHPCLVAYRHLPEAEKEYDRATARVVLAALIGRGLIRAG
ncbi:MAG: RyR domain-containing protein [Thermodesulfobacteriota bacterium]